LAPSIAQRAAAMSAAMKSSDAKSAYAIDERFCK